MYQQEKILQERFLHCYQRTFPHKAQAEVLSFAPLASGWESELFVLTLAYQEGEERKTARLVLKMVQGERRRQKATLEYSNIKLLARAGYPVPRLFQFFAQESEPGPYILMEYISGQNLAEMFQAATEEARYKALFGHFCTLFVQLHALDWQAFVPYPAHYAQQDLLALSLIDLERPLLAHQCSLFQPVFTWLRQAKKEIREISLAVNHLDFHGANILFRDDVTPVVLDWANVAVTDFRMDLAWTCVLQPDWRDQILENYQCLSGRRIEQFAFFEVLASLKRLSTIVLSTRLQTGEPGLRRGIEQDFHQQRSQLQQICALLTSRTGIVLPEIEQIIAQL